MTPERAKQLADAGYSVTHFPLADRWIACGRNGYGLLYLELDTYSGKIARYDHYGIHNATSFATEREAWQLCMYDLDTRLDGLGVNYSTPNAVREPVQRPPAPFVGWIKRMLTSRK